MYQNCVLGTVIQDPSSMEAAENLKPSDFTGCNVKVWEAVLDLHKRGALGQRTLVEHMRRNETLEFVGTDDGDIRGEDYINYLTTFGESSNIKEFVHQVESSSIRKQLNGIASLIVAGSVNEREVDDILDNAEKQLYSLRRTSVDDGQTMGDIIKILMPRMDGFRDGSIQPAWIPEILALRNIVDYVDATDFIVIGGRPGEGKSSLMRWEALKMAQTGKSVITYNLENDALEYAKFAISAMTGIDSHKLRNPRLLSNREMERARDAAQVLIALPWRIITMARPTVVEIERSARKLAVTQKVDRIDVDYMQLIWNGIDNRVYDLSMTTATLRGIATRLKVPVLAGSQLSRNIEVRNGQGQDREGSTPMLADLRDSGSLEQDSTQVWVIRIMWSNPPSQAQINGARYPENTEGIVRAVPVKVFVLKNRNGPIGVTEMIKWIKSTNTYLTLTRD